MTKHHQHLGLSFRHGAEEERWVDDSSVDHRGRPPLRAATGSWKAAMFIILIEFSERLSYFGIATSLMIYLTKVLHQDMKVAAENSNYWMSVTTLMPLLGGFLADAYLGRFRTVLFSTVVYLLGLVVEETKLVVSMVPIWVATLPFGITTAQVSTFFVKQGSVMDRRMGPHFVLPPASILAPARVTGTERGLSVLRRIGVGMALAVVAMAVAAGVERRRLPSTAPMSVCWLLPQFALMGVADGFALVGLQEYFYDQVPDSMRSLGIGLYLSVIGAGSFLSGLVIAAADHVSSHGGRRAGWFGKDLSRSRLDLFYWLLAAISAVNLGFYVLVAARYSYKQTVKAKRVSASDVECATAVAA
uniref:Peptide transporter PTR5 n=1 Tax=Aegilops tauschii TaxID=37682 RepID=M8B0K8_AEGTA